MCRSWRRTAVRPAGQPRGGCPRVCRYNFCHAEQTVVSLNSASVDQSGDGGLRRSAHGMAAVAGENRTMQSGMAGQGYAGRRDGCRSCRAGLRIVRDG
jgi:hypothetical protein